MFAVRCLFVRSFVRSFGVPPSPSSDCKRHSEVRQCSWAVVCGRDGTGRGGEGRAQAAKLARWEEEEEVQMKCHDGARELNSSTLLGTVRRSGSSVRAAMFGWCVRRAKPAVRRTPRL